MADFKNKYIRIHPADNVLVALVAIQEGEKLLFENKEITVKRSIGLGHKLAATAIKNGDKIIKYGMPIGLATKDICPGEHVHIHNIRSDYLPTYTLANK